MLEMPNSYFLIRQHPFAKNCMCIVQVIWYRRKENCRHCSTVQDVREAQQQVIQIYDACRLNEKTPYLIFALHVFCPYFLYTCRSTRKSRISESSLAKIGHG